METSYLKLTDGARLKNHAGLRMEAGFQHKFGKNYLFLEIPILGVLDEETDKFVTEVKRNQHVFVRAACTVEVKGLHFIEIEPNADVSEYGTVQGIYRLHPDSGYTEVGFWFTARKDIDLSTFGYAVRIYMPA